MKPTRLTQPYRKGARHPGPALNAMLRGRSASGMNAADVTRAAYRLMAAAKAPSRPARPARPKRAPRPPR